MHGGRSRPGKRLVARFPGFRLARSAGGGLAGVGPNTPTRRPCLRRFMPSDGAPLVAQRRRGQRDRAAQRSCPARLLCWLPPALYRHRPCEAPSRCHPSLPLRWFAPPRCPKPCRCGTSVTGPRIAPDSVSVRASVLRFCGDACALPGQAHVALGVACTVSARLNFAGVRAGSGAVQPGGCWRPRLARPPVVHRPRTYSTCCIGAGSVGPAARQPGSTQAATPPPNGRSACQHGCVGLLTSARSPLTTPPPRDPSLRPNLTYRLHVCLNVQESVVGLSPTLSGVVRRAFCLLNMFPSKRLDTG